MHYESEWRALGYPRGMGSSKFLPPPPKDVVRAYHLTTSDHAISNVSLNRLKVTRFSEANDPFELEALNCHKREIRQLVRAFKNTHDNKMGLLCFSANWTNPLLWSHYAGNHTGICLGFDLPRRDAECVVYKRKRPRLEHGPGTASISAEIKFLLLRTKFIGWKYEQECRKFVDLSRAIQEKNLYFWPFGVDLSLREVILGERNNLSPDAVRKMVSITNPNCVIFKTRLERRDFRIVGDGDYPPHVPIAAA